MGAQMVSSVGELIFTDKEDSLLLTFADGRTVEVFGDGQLQEAQTNGDVIVRQV